LEHERVSLAKTGVILLGVPQRPQGVILRFELALESGDALVRGEGRVVGYREKAHGDLPGLVLRFTKLDPRSKAFLDRVFADASEPASQRDVAIAVATPEPPKARPEPRHGSVPVPRAPARSRTSKRPPPMPPRPRAPSVPPPAPPLPMAASLPLASEVVTPADLPLVALTEETPEAPRAVADAVRVAQDVLTSDTKHTLAPSPDGNGALHAALHRAVDETGAAAVTAPADRDELLDRLRTRRKTLTEEDVERILTPGHDRRTGKR
jgi:hypothetical protein